MKYKKTKCKRRRAQSAPERHPQTTRVPVAPSTVCTTFLPSLSVSLLKAFKNKKTNISLRLSSVTKWNKEINCASKSEYKELHGCFFVVFTTDLDILLPTQQLYI